MTLALPTRYRRDGLRYEYQRAGDAQEITIKCLRCFNPATVGLRCDRCREHRKQANKGRKR